MIVICEECGKKYRIDPAKIPEKGARFKCKSCSNVITVSKPEGTPSEPPPSPANQMPAQDGEERPVATEPAEQKKPASIKKSQKPRRKPTGLGLRTKMALLFVFIPIVLIAAAGALYLWQLNTLASDITSVSSKVVTQMAEDVIQENARAVAKQCNLYLASHPQTQSVRLPGLHHWHPLKM